MKEVEINQSLFTNILPKICDKETSLDPDNWREDNPLCGHCAVVSLLAQELWGGELLRASLASVEDFEHMRSHYWNKINETDVDFTKNQFGENYPANLQPEIRTREYVLSFPETVKRYELLKSRLFEILHK